MIISRKVNEIRDKQLECWIAKCSALEQELDRYKQAERDGRSAVLPLPLQSTAYDISQGEIEPMEKIHISLAYTQSGIVFHMPIDTFLDGVKSGSIKATYEEAEKALKGESYEIKHR
jgi:hypothetical protein